MDRKVLSAHGKEKFSEDELRVLTAEVTRHEIELFGKASANISHATEEAIWSSTVEKVNAVRVTRRTSQPGDEKSRQWRQEHYAELPNRAGNGDKNILLCYRTEQAMETISPQERR
ncbi:UNVERIFIED_CONTAM: hypothetical protein FKN15_049430 [Acipenser sinensis]